MVLISAARKSITIVGGGAIGQEMDQNKYELGNKKWDMQWSPGYWGKSSMTNREEGSTLPAISKILEKGIFVAVIIFIRLVKSLDLQIVS